MTSGVGTFGFVVGLLVSFGTGYAWAVTKRAWSDYNIAKDALPGMKKTAWDSVWTTVKAAALAAVVFILFVAWIVSDVRKQ